MDETTKIVQEHYDKSVLHEWNRIADRPEFILTCRMLDRYIKPGNSVLDIGGGPGRYSFHLAEKGCNVTLFDLSPENIMHVNERSAEQGLPVRAVCGDVREIDRHICEQYDHVLLMGPLYHLLDEHDRVTAVEASLKLLKPGGLLFAAFISMGGGLVFLLRELPEHILMPGEERFISPLVAGESYGGAAFTQAFFINQNEVLPFMSKFPLEKLHLFGQESILAPNEHTFKSQEQEVKAAWLDLAEKMWEKEEYLSWSEHLMYVGRKKDEPVHSPAEDGCIIQKEIDYYNSLPCEFEGFFDVPELSDGVIYLVCINKSPANEETKYSPGYEFAICKDGEKIGGIGLRIGYGGGPYNSNLYYGGQIGYNIDEAHRGNGYAGRACRLVVPMAKMHKMEKLLITTNYTNTASMRVCEKLGARLIRVVHLPPWNDLYKLDQRLQNIYEWDI